MSSWMVSGEGELAPLLGSQGLGRAGDPRPLWAMCCTLARSVNGMRHQFRGRRVARSSRGTSCLVLYLFFMLWTLSN